MPDDTNESSPTTIAEQRAAERIAERRGVDPSGVESVDIGARGRVQNAELSDKARLRRAAEQSETYDRGDLRTTEDGVEARPEARKQAVAQGTEYDADELRVEDGEVTVREPTERVDVRVFDDDISGDVEIVGPGGERRDLGAEVAGDEPFFARVDAPDREGQYRIEVGGETVKRFEVGRPGAAVDRPGNLDFGWNGAVLTADRGETGARQSPSRFETPDEDVVAGAGAAEALQAGGQPERLSQVNPISEREGDQIAEALAQADARDTEPDTQPDPIGEGMSDTQLATRGSEANRRLRQRVAARREGLDASQVDLVATDDGLAYQTDGDTIGGEELDFGDADPGGASPGPAAPSPAEAFDADGDGTLEGRVETRESGPSRGDVRAAVNRFGQAQLDAQDTSEQFGDVDASVGLGDPREDEVERFLDETLPGAVQNRVTDPGRDALDALDGDGTGTSRPVGVPGVGVVGQSSPGALGARFGDDLLGFVDDAARFPGATLEGVETAGYVLGEVDDDSPDDALGGVVGFAAEPEQAERRASQVNRRAVAAGARAAAFARENPRDVTTEAFAGAAVSGAGSSALTRASRLGRADAPDVSGSDLSGRALQAAARGGRGARRFVRDDRAQANLLFGGDGDDAGGGDTVDLVDETALAEPEGEGQLARPPEGVSGASRDRQAAGLNQQGAFVGSNTNQQDAAFGGTGKPDTSGMDFSNVEFEELPRLQDRGETAGDAADVTGRSVDEDAIAPPGRRQAAGSSLAAALVAPALNRQASAQSSSVFRGDAVFGEGIGAGSRDDVFGRTDTGVRADALGGGRTEGLNEDVLGRGDTTARGDTRTGTDARDDLDVYGRTDTRTDTRMDTRTDTRVDLDTRQDTRVDFDGRTDTPLRLDFDDRDDPPLRFDLDDRDDEDDGLGAAPDWLARSETFDTGVVQSLDELEDSSGGAFDGFGDPFDGDDPLDNLRF